MNQTADQRLNSPCRRCGVRSKLSIYNQVIDLCEVCELEWASENRTLARLVRLATDSFEQLVFKGWGTEIWTVNHEKYCQKFLFFFEGKQFSDHYHPIKQEIWTFLAGDFQLYLDGDPEPALVHPGEVHEIVPGRRHRLFAREDALVLEVSTQHFEEDSVRVSPGD